MERNTEPAQTKAKPVQPWMEAAAIEIEQRCIVCDRGDYDGFDAMEAARVIAAHAPSSSASARLDSAYLAGAKVGYNLGAEGNAAGLVELETSRKMRG